uniref:SoHo domain-containing protein n=1 Tax=Accipiter nisus TaxID=211598 RepID=A0A8B9LWV6_9AVES
VIRHRGSNTLNFDFHHLETRGAAERGQAAPRSSGTCPDSMAGPGATPACPRPPGWSATWTKDNKRRERRWVKYDGIGPVDETGMPIASRSSVDRPRDWYRSMFRQIHRKLPGESRYHGTARRGTAPAHLLLHPRRAGLGCPPGGPGARAAGTWGAGSASLLLPTQVLLERELEQLSEELDNDMRAMETRRHPSGSGEGRVRGSGAGCGVQPCPEPP